MHDPDRIIVELDGLCAQPIDVDVVHEVEELWCAPYGVRSEVDHHVRYTIGMYQIKQMMVSYNTPHRAECAAAAALHMIAAARMVGATVWDKMPRRFSEINKEFDAEALLYAIAGAMQQHCYLRTTKPGSARNCRIDLNVLGLYTRDIVMMTQVRVPATQRADGFKREINLLLNMEWKK